jgi:hypothetical protein
VPLGQVLDAISHAARQLDLRLRWCKEDGDPVALVTFPRPRDSQAPAVWLDVIELRQGELYVAGQMSRGAPQKLAEALQPPGDEPESNDQPLVGAAEKDTRQE